MIIAVDAMASDAGAVPLVEGAVMAAERLDCHIKLVGRQHSMKRLLHHFRYRGDKIEIVHAPKTVAMDASPRVSLAQRTSSIAVTVQLAKEDQADAVVSAGNTGASLAHCMRNWNRLKGIKRPGIATLMPTRKLPCLIIDAGANVDCKPRHLLDFAVMGSVYSRHVLGRTPSRIGLLSVGEERSKGNSLSLAAFELLDQSHLNFVGNCEPGDVFDGGVDVLVCDGFVGNVFLKVAESVAQMMVSGIKGAAKRNVITLAGAMMMAPGMREIRRKVDQSEYGGAPLLGLEHICIIGHGGSSAKAVMNAIRVAEESVERGVNRLIREEIKTIAKEVAHVKLEGEQGE